MEKKWHGELAKSIPYAEGSLDVYKNSDRQNPTVTVDTGHGISVTIRYSTSCRCVLAIVDRGDGTQPHVMTFPLPETIDEGDYGFPPSHGYNPNDPWTDDWHDDNPPENLPELVSTDLGSIDYPGFLEYCSFSICAVEGTPSPSVTIGYSQERDVVVEYDAPSRRIHVFGWYHGFEMVNEYWFDPHDLHVAPEDEPDNQPDFPFRINNPWEDPVEEPEF